MRGGACCAGREVGVHKLLGGGGGGGGGLLGGGGGGGSGTGSRGDVVRGVFALTVD